MELRIEITNWEKHNPKRAQKTYTWVRLDNTFHSDRKFFGLSPVQKYLWVLLLCVASEGNTGSFFVDTEWLAGQTNMTESEIIQTLDIFQMRKVSKHGVVSCSAYSDALHGTTPTYERTNETYETYETYDARAEKIENKTETQSDKIDPVRVIEIWNEVMTGVGGCKMFPSHFLPSKALENFLVTVGFKEFSKLERWKEYFQKLAACESVQDGDWIVDLCWAVEHDNAVKTLSGKYDKSRKRKREGPQVISMADNGNPHRKLRAV